MNYQFCPVVTAIYVITTATNFGWKRLHVLSLKDDLRTLVAEKDKELNDNKIWVFQIRKLLQWNDIILNHVNYAMEWHICKNIQTRQDRKRWKFVHFVHQGSVGETFYHSIMSIRSYFKPVDNKSLFGEALQISTGEVSSTQMCVARQPNASMQ